MYQINVNNNSKFTIHLLSILRFVFWILVGRSLLIRDRKLASSFKFVGWLRCLEGLGVVGCLSDLFLESDGTTTIDSRSGVSFLTQVFWLVLVSSRGIRTSAKIWLSCGDEKVGVLLLGVSADVMVFWSDFGVSSERLVFGFCLWCH